MAQVKKKAKVRAKSKTRTTSKAASKSAVKRKPHNLVPEFLVVSIPENVKEGSSIKLLHVAASLDAASQFIEKLSGSGARYYSILEKKSILKRAPIMKTSLAERNIIIG